MYQSIPKPPIPPGQSPGIWLALSSVQRGIWPKMRPPGGAFDFRVKTSVISQFFDSARERRSRVIALVDSTWVFLLLSFYIVISWNMPLFKVWSADKLNKKFVVAENLAGNLTKIFQKSQMPRGLPGGGMGGFGIDRYIAWRIISELWVFNTAYIGLFDRSLLHMSLNQLELVLKNTTFKSRTPVSM